ncbi:MAG TPA: hypothetical protein VGX03_00535 [Candidatus Binatia bacterium]|jgi:hypothetical protein|nr:hypothetical protein [Candidatus Binatia bacterium]
MRSENIRQAIEEFAVQGEAALKSILERRETEPALDFAADLVAEMNRLSGRVEALAWVLGDDWPQTKGK